MGRGWSGANTTQRAQPYQTKEIQRINGIVLQDNCVDMNDNVWFASIVSESCVPEDLQRVLGLICWDSFNFKFANGATVQYRSVLSMTHVGRIQMIQAQLEVGAHCRVRWGVLSSPGSQIRSVESPTESDQECWTDNWVRSEVLDTPSYHIRTDGPAAELDQEW